MRAAIRWIPAALWAVVIFIGSSLPGTLIPGTYSAWGHLGEYLVLGALTAGALRGDDRGTVLMAIALCALYGATDEFHQLFVPYRTADALDWLTDVAGSAIGVAVYLLWTLRRDRRPRQ